jgi:Fe-S cluster assembly scaffold protein SufB
MAAVMIGYIKEQPATEETEELLSKASGRFSSRSSKRLSSLQTKKQLREDVIMWKEKYEVEATRCQNLSRSLDEHVQQNSRLKEELREARNRVQESHQEKQRLERTVHDLRAKTPSDRPDSVAEKSRSSAAGLREFRLGKSNTAPVTSSKRSSSSLLFSATSSDTADNESLLAELVTAKTAEAVARQELEEVKAKLETLRKLISRNPTAASSISPGSGGGANITVTPPPHSSTSGSPAPSPSVGGFFSGWTRRTASTTNAVIT